MALSSRSWLNYTYQDRLEFAPLIYDSLEYASSFSAEMCPDGLIGVAGNTLRYVSRDRPSALLTSLQDLYRATTWHKAQAGRSALVVHPSKDDQPPDAAVLLRH
jgi:hypothetical protein